MVLAMAGAIGESFVAIWGLLSRKDCLAAALVQGCDGRDADIFPGRTRWGSCFLVATRKDFSFHNILDQITDLVAASFPVEHWGGAAVDGSLCILLLDIGMRWMGHLCCLVCDGDIAAGSTHASVHDGYCIGGTESAAGWFECLWCGRSQLLWLVLGGDWIVTIFGAKSQRERYNDRSMDTLEWGSTDHDGPVMGPSHFVHDILAES